MTCRQPTIKTIPSSQCRHKYIVYFVLPHGTNSFLLFYSWGPGLEKEVKKTFHNLYEFEIREIEYLGEVSYDTSGNSRRT